MGAAQERRRLAVLDKGDGGPDLGARAGDLVRAAVFLRAGCPGAGGEREQEEEGQKSRRRGHCLSVFCFW